MAIMPNLQWYIVLIWVLLLVSWAVIRGGGSLEGFVSALNSVNTPWVAILVMVIGMLFDIASQKYNMSTDAATGVIGAGIGMLTQNALHSQQKTTTNPPQTSTNITVDPSTGTVPTKTENVE